MKSLIRNLSVFSMLAAGLCLPCPIRATAQTFTVLYNFGLDGKGKSPNTGMILFGDTLYGTTEIGGGIPGGHGTVYKIKTNGTSYSNVHSFTAPSPTPPYGNLDGSQPAAAVILSGNTLYSTTYVGGSAGLGTVFAVNTNGTAFATLRSFGGFDGDSPRAGLVLMGNTLYGASYDRIFAINTDSTGFRTVHGFTGGTDGAYPQGSLVLSDGNLYGTGYYGGTSGNGTVFKVNIDGTGFTTLHTFTSLNNFTNSDGAVPAAGLLLWTNTLFGTTSAGGSSGNGTIFKINIDGSDFTTLYSFSASSTNSSGFFTNYDGIGPRANLILSSNVLFGTAIGGGTWGNGTVFKVKTDGTSFVTLHSFTATSGSPPANFDGVGPNGLVLSGDILYGTSQNGGNWGGGTLFSISLTSSPPQLSIAASGTNVVLKWPTSVTGFALQATTNLISPTAWIAVAPAPVVVSGQYTVTNLVSGKQRFYRLSQ